MYQSKVRERIKKQNGYDGFETVFYRNPVRGAEDGYSYGNTIYINLETERSLECVNLHEKLHFYDKTPAFERVKYDIITSLDQRRYKKMYMNYLTKYYTLYEPEDIDEGIIDTEIVIDILSGNVRFNFKFEKKVEDYLLDVLEEKPRTLDSKRYSSFSFDEISTEEYKNIDFNNIKKEHAEKVATPVKTVTLNK